MNLHCVLAKHLTFTESLTLPLSKYIPSHFVLQKLEISVNIMNLWLNPFTPRVTFLGQSFPTFDSIDIMSVTIHWKAVDQFFTMMLCVFQFHPVCNFEKFLNFGLGTVRVKGLILYRGM